MTRLTTVRRFRLKDNKCDIIAFSGKRAIARFPCYFEDELPPVIRSSKNE